MISTRPLGTEEQRGQRAGWYPDRCQHAVPGDGSACHQLATRRATVQVMGVWFQSWLCDQHAALVDSGVSA